MERELAISIESMDHREDTVIVEMSGTKPQVMPDMVTKSRVRMKAVRAVGVEHIPRNMVEAIMEGDFALATGLLDYETYGGNGVGEPVEFTAAVEVARGQ